MIKTEILQKDAAALRKKSMPVPVKSIRTKKIQGILDRMKRALNTEEDGVAIAAPQIGENLRIFVVSGKVLSLTEKTKHSDADKELHDLVFINPEILKTSKRKKKVEEGCLSLRWLYGQVKRSEKVTIRAYDEKGRLVRRGASGLLAQIFQHETDHLDGILFTDKAENVQDIPPQKVVKFVFFGSSKFSTYVLEELERAGFSPIRTITSTKEPLPIEELKKIKADVFVVASFGKILPKEIIELPKYGTLNVHPSLLPQLRGPAPIQDTILGRGEPGITIIRVDEKMDHGPILARGKIPITPWPDHYRVVEEKLGRAGGRILGLLLSKWVLGEIQEVPQDDVSASFTKLLKKEDGLLNLDDPAEQNLRKVLAYSTWPGAYINFKKKNGEEIRVIIKDAKLENCTNENSLEIENCKLKILSVIPAGKREMDWQDFLRGN